MTKVSFAVTFENEFANDDEAWQHMLQTVRYIGTNVVVKMVPTESIIVESARFERLLEWASYASRKRCWGKTPDTMLNPGDLDPIP